jgi:ankyrin repeat protein
VHITCVVYLVQVLLSNGSNVHDRDFMGTSAMSLACGSQNTDLCWLLLKWGADFSGLCSNGAKWLADQVRKAQRQ